MVRIATHPEALRLFGLSIEEMGPALLAPSTDVTLSEWMEANRMLGESSPIKGPYRFEHAPYLREIADAFTNPDFRRGVVLKAARVGYTEVINGAIGYIIDQDPGNILVYWPTQPDAVRWAKETLPEMIRTTLCLHGKIADPELGRAPNTTILHRRHHAGWLHAIGSNSPSSARGQNARYIFIDEFDVLDARRNKKEGDFGARAVRRAQNDPNAKILQGGSPQALDSRTTREYAASDQREYHCCCPHCRHLQVPIWDNVRWDKERDDKGVVLVHRTREARYACVSCGAVIHEGPEKEAFVSPEHGARWIARYPGRDVWGWKIPALFSLMVAWGVLATEYVTAAEQLKREGDPDLMIEWKQQVMAEPFEFRSTTGELVPPEKRREVYPAEVPMNVGILVATVDKQDDRLELLIRGFGVGLEAWDIAHHRIYGDPEQLDVWTRLSQLVWRPFQHEGGATLFVRAVGVDSGDAPERVYAWVKKYAGRNAWSLKGAKMKKGDPLVIRSKTKRAERLFLIDDARFKRQVLRRLRIKEAGPGYMHFPMYRPGGDGLDDEYLKQFDNEREVPDGKSGDGVVRTKWDVKGPNEAIDLAKMALAIMSILGDAVTQNLPQIVQRVQAEGAALRATDLAVATPVHPAVTATRGRRRMGSGKGIEV
jgi:phage terminase large subunit GpA-like protein